MGDKKGKYAQKSIAVACMAVLLPPIAKNAVLKRKNFRYSLS